MTQKTNLPLENQNFPIFVLKNLTCSGILYILFAPKAFWLVILKNHISEHLKATFVSAQKS